MHQPYTPWALEERIRLVATYDELHKQAPRFSARQFSIYHDVPYATFARWLARFRHSGAASLRDRSHAAKRRPHKLSGAEETVIRRAHKELRCGVHRLYFYLRALKLTSRSFASVYRVLSRCGALVKRRRKPKPNWQMYAKAWPGERAQMDIKYLPEGFYQLTLIDDCSRLTAATVMTGRAQADVIAALPRLFAAFPFALQCIQTDNGSEFESAFHRVLEEQGVRHVRIRPRTPHLNGKVERVQRTIAEEYWDGVTSAPGPAWEHGLQRYLRTYNRQRPHRSLDYQTPWRYAHQRLAEAAPVSHIT